MTFAAPLALWALLLVPVLVAGYLLAQRRRARDSARFADGDLLAGLVTAAPRWRRHLPATGCLLAMGALLVGLARPQATVLVPREQATVVLVMDVSRSMLARDVTPTRLEAAKAAAKRFVDKVPRKFKLGIVSFSDTAQVVTLPTTDRRLVYAGIDSLQPIGSTAIGEGIRESLRVGRRAAATAHDGQADHAASPGANQGGSGGPRGGRAGDRGDQAPLVLLLLSDGKNSEGVAPQVAAQEARQQGVPVFTVALGTPNGVLTQDRRGIPNLTPVPPDPQALAEVASITDGRFFEAATNPDLQAVYDELGSRIGFEHEQRDITVWFNAAGVALLLASGLFSLAWFNRLPP